MSRPLIVCDCDEVILHMVVPFRAWLDEAHDIHFDFANGFADALRHKNTGDALDPTEVWPLLAEFFREHMDRQGPIEGAVEALNRLSADADLIILTNIGDELGPAREAQLRRVGLNAPVIGNRGGKGRPLAALLEGRHDAPTVFIDDLGEQHASVAAHAPAVWRLQLVGEPEMAPHAATAGAAHTRIDRWAEAESWVREKLAGRGAGSPDSKGSGRRLDPSRSPLHLHRP